MHLRLLQAHAVALQCAEHLFDTPSQAIQPHDFARCGGIGYLDRGQQVPT
jgi:hypothetical protein